MCADRDDCPLAYNPGQADADGDGIGDECDPDLDADGVPNATDNCPHDANADQRDTDRDGRGDACDADRDGDGIVNTADHCPAVADAAGAPPRVVVVSEGQSIALEAGVGLSISRGAVAGSNLIFTCGSCAGASPGLARTRLGQGSRVCGLGPHDLADQRIALCALSTTTASRWDLALRSHRSFLRGCADSDGGATCAATGGRTSLSFQAPLTEVDQGPDSDHDGVADVCDNCATVPNAGQEDGDGDGIGDACDPDRDGDGIEDAFDDCPAVPNPGQEDLDGDGRGDACDPDLDGDGVPNGADNCPAAPNPTQADRDGNGIGNACDAFVDTEPPVVTCPADLEVAGTGPAGATVPLAGAVARDEIDGAVPVSCDRASAASFGYGASTVTCAASDASGNQGKCSYQVRVLDRTPPRLTCPADLEAPGVTAEGAAVSFEAPAASDDHDPAPQVTCDHLAGGAFPYGDTLVSCTATDTAQNLARCAFRVVVRDLTPPQIRCPADLEVSGTDASGAVVSYEVPVATDLVDPRPLVSCTIPAGAQFVYGTTAVSCEAVDASGNRRACTFAVTVADRTPPTITCPADVTVEGTGPPGATVSLPLATATDLVDPAPAVGCEPASPAALLYGLTQVSCAATDAAGNRAACSFGVTVVDLPPVLSLRGAPALTLECGEPFVEPGYEASDLRDGDLSGRVLVTSDLVPAPGSHTVSYSVRDQAGSAASAQRAVFVIDTRPPSLAVRAEPSILWPPNHKLHRVRLLWDVTDRCDRAPVVRLVSVSVSEIPRSDRDDDADGPVEEDDEREGHEDHPRHRRPPDIVGADLGTADTEILLRAERGGHDATRVYTITYEAIDASGNRIQAAAEVRVPHDRRR